MALTRRLARPLLAAIFVAGGWDALRNPEGKAAKAVAVTDPLAEKAGVERFDPATLVRVNGAVQIAGGVLLAVGKFRRLAALGLIGSIIPTTYAGHRFWEETDPATRAQQRTHFLKNVGLLGGLILAAFDTEGEPSLAWRAKRQARQIESSVTAGRAAGRRKARRARRDVAPVVAQASRQALGRGRAAGRRVGRQAQEAGSDLAGKVIPDPDTLSHAHDAVADVVKSSADAAGHVVQHAAAFVSDAAQQLQPLAKSAPHPNLSAVAPSVSAGVDRAGDVLSKLRDRLPGE